MLFAAKVKCPGCHTIFTVKRRSMFSLIPEYNCRNSICPGWGYEPFISRKGYSRKGYRSILTGGGAYTYLLPFQIGGATYLLQGDGPNTYIIHGMRSIATIPYIDLPENDDQLEEWFVSLRNTLEKVLLLR